MRDLGYYPNDMARSLSRKSSNFIGLIIPSARNCFFAEFIHFVEAAAEEQSCRLLLCVSNEDSRKEQEYYQMLLSNKVMGVISGNYFQAPEKVVPEAAPFVVFEKTPDSSVPCALSDDRQGGRLAGDHLFEKGCRHLLYLGGNAAKNDVSQLRYDGLAEACQSHGMADPVQMDASWQEFLSMDYSRVIARIFQDYPETDGILASNDVIAAGIVNHCVRHGIDIPQKVRVIGYDDTFFASQCVIPLTTIAQPIEALARHAVNCVIRRARGETVPSSTLFPVQLKERGTA